MFGAVGGLLLWAQVAALVTVGAVSATGSPSTGTVVYGFLALFEVYSIQRAAYDVRY